MLFVCFAIFGVSGDLVSSLRDIESDMGFLNGLEG